MDLNTSNVIVQRYMENVSGYMTIYLNTSNVIVQHNISIRFCGGNHLNTSNVIVQLNNFKRAKNKI